MVPGLTVSLYTVPMPAIELLHPVGLPQPPRLCSSVRIQHCFLQKMIMMLDPSLIPSPVTDSHNQGGTAHVYLLSPGSWHCHPEGKSRDSRSIHTESKHW